VAQPPDWRVEGSSDAAVATPVRQLCTRAPTSRTRDADSFEKVNLRQLATPSICGTMRTSL
jgi:hypothetical protein